MKVEIREIKVYTAEIDPMDVVKAYPVEWREFLGDAAQTGGWDQDDVEEFARDSFHECGSDIFLDLEAKVDLDNETEVTIR